jgi:YVTN family beta-propeller protein
VGELPGRGSHSRLARIDSRRTSKWCRPGVIGTVILLVSLGVAGETAAGRAAATNQASSSGFNSTGSGSLGQGSLPLTPVPGSGENAAPLGVGTTPQISAGSGPRFATSAPYSPNVYVDNFGSANVSVLDGSLHVKNIPVGTDPGEPIADFNNGHIYVPNGGSHNVSVIGNLSVIATVSVGSASDPIFGISVPGGPLYIPNSASTNTVDDLHGTQLFTTITVGVGPHSATYDPNNGDVYVPCWSSGTVSVIQGSAQIASISVGLNPLFAVYDSRNSYMYVTNQGGNSVSVINPTSNTVIATVAVGSGPTSLVFDTSNGYIYVSNSVSGSVSIINGTTNLQTLTVGSTPRFAAFNAASDYVYIPNSGGSSVSLLNGTNVVASISTGSSPYSITTATSNGWVLVPNSGSANLTLVEALLTLKVYSSPSDSQANSFAYIQVGSTTLYDGQIVSVVPGHSYALAFVNRSNGWNFFEWEVSGGSVAADYQPATELTVSSGQAVAALVLSRSHTLSSSFSWAGYDQSGMKVQNVTMAVGVPTITFDSHESCDLLGSYTQHVAIWAGVGGSVASSKLWQAGLWLGASCQEITRGVYVYTYTYCLFWEAFPANDVQPFACGGVAAGDTMQISVNYDPHTSVDSYFIWDATKGTKWQGSYNGFDPFGFSGKTNGEAIVEDPTCYGSSCQPNGLYPLPFFSAVTVSGLNVSDRGPEGPPSPNFFSAGPIANLGLYETNSGISQWAGTGPCSSVSQSGCLPSNNDFVFTIDDFGG